jgi:hypothetical protein
MAPVGAIGRARVADEYHAISLLQFVTSWPDSVSRSATGDILWIRIRVRLAVGSDVWKRSAAVMVAARRPPGVGHTTAGTGGWPTALVPRWCA